MVRRSNLSQMPFLMLHAVPAGIEPRSAGSSVLKTKPQQLLGKVRVISNYKLEGCIDNERQFKTAKCSQVPGDATVLKGFFHNNFVTFCHRLKRIAFLEAVNFSMCVYMQNFNFRDGHVTTFRHPTGVYLPNAWSQTLKTSKRHTFRVSAFHQYHWFGVNCFL